MPLYCKPQITFSLTGGGRVNVMVGTKANRDKPVEDVVITIPFPKVVSTVNLTASHGRVAFDEVSKICRWEVGTIPKDAPLLQVRPAPTHIHTRAYTRDYACLCTSVVASVAHG